MKKSIQLSSSKYQIRYTEEFKRHVCNEYIAGQGGKNELARKYGIGGSSTITKWLRSFGYENTPPDCNSTFLEDDLKEATKGKKKEQELKEENKRLKEELDNKRLQVEMYSTMIDIAEKELGIDIRKKSNTK